jgi:hypothetical protein
LTVLADVAVNPAAPNAPKKFTLLPLLTVLFLVSYGLMTLLIMEQGSTIESQRGLIREMLHDSVELSAMKGKVVQDKNVADVQRRARTGAPLNQAPSTQTPLTQAPSTQTPSAQMPRTQAPSTQVAPNHNARSQVGKVKPRFQTPSRPASDLADERRIVMTI